MWTHQPLYHAAGIAASLIFVSLPILSQGKVGPFAAPTSASPTSAPQQQVNAVAVRLADAITRSKDDSVVVFDFVSSDRRLGKLGAVLADNLSTALAAPAVKLHVKDHSDLNKLMAENGLESENVFDPGIATWLAEDVGAQALVLGTLGLDAGNVALSVTSFDVRKGRGIVGLAVTIPLTNEMKALIPDTVETEAASKLVSLGGKCGAKGSTPCGGTNGYSFPKCVRCPQPDYSEEATEHGTEGTAVFVVIIDESGKAKDIRVARALPYGLTRQAIQAIQKWTFQPATGPNGKPIAVHQTIEVSFHFFP